MNKMKDVIELWRQTKSPLVVVRNFGETLSTLQDLQPQPDWQAEDALAYKDLSELVEALEIWKCTLEIEKGKLGELINTSEKTFQACLSYHQRNTR